MFYLDACVIVSALTHEAAAGRVWDWLEARDPETLFISRWVTTELSSALSIKVRSGILTLEHRADAMTVFRRVAEESLEMHTITDGHFETAGHFVDQVARGLRGGDALHLAISQAYGLTLATLDKQLAEAGPQLGVATLLL